MGKRSEGFERNPRDHYRTWDFRAVKPLLRFLPPGTLFVEPCAGDGVLVDHLVRAGHRCHAAIDVEPLRGDVRRGDALRIRWPAQNGMFITNPPWSRDIMHALIRHLSRQAPYWMLADAGWMHNVESLPFHPYLQKIVSIGRVCWIEGTDQTGKDDCAWYLLDWQRPTRDILFFGREP